MTAATSQWRTSYSFNTKAGLPVFYQEFERLLEVLLHPDYSDEEIRREVRNFGIAKDPATHQLHLEEKGSVYKEMRARRSSDSIFSSAGFGRVATPRFVGLFKADLQGGVFDSMVPGVDYKSTDRESLLLYLTRNIFSGSGAHSAFSKTNEAGLAYGNGFAGSLRDGTSTYYAERTPDVTQTLHFVFDTVRHSPREPGFADYALAGAFRQTNAAGSYEARAKAIADDLADGITPDVVRRFRLAVLELRKDPALAAKLFKRVDKVYGPIVPGYGPRAKQVPGAIYYLIGNDKQFQSLDADVWAREREHVYKLFPRAYWLM